MSLKTKIGAVKRGIRRILEGHGNNKFLYYAGNYLFYPLPRSIFNSKLKKRLSALNENDAGFVNPRVEYYNKLKKTQPIDDHAPALSTLRIPKERSDYFFDFYCHARYFGPALRVQFEFGDVTHIPDKPCIVKSRPIRGENSNSVILKLEKARHFIFVRDRKEFQEKKNMLVWRGAVHQPHRVRFLEKHFDNPLCDLGQTNLDKNTQWAKSRMTIGEQLSFKFILSLEGNDVASNLKWVMSSNSLTIMPMPVYETWYMEGTLVPGVHFVQIKDDYSDLSEKLLYYIEHTDEALQIIRNAHAHIAQFKNKEKEDLISLLVLQKYFMKTGQLGEAGM